MEQTLSSSQVAIEIEIIAYLKYVRHCLNIFTQIDEFHVGELSLKLLALF